ncbi:MAG TPA: hypothetical protein VKE51_14125, partial [Vicinamibacterales bacterium]|nr:hypothetical protein [Vicinamibacterales bacterium]
GEGRRRADVERHLDGCASCAALYREIAGTLAMIAAPEVPERGDQYGLEVWQRIRHKLPEQDAPWWTTLLRADRVGFAAAAALLLVAAFVAGRVWQRQSSAPALTQIASDGAPAATAAPAADVRQRILLTSVADHLDRSERVLTDIMNAPDRGNISTEQQWAEDLIDASRFYRQDAIDAGEQSVADVLDDLERSLLEIVHSPSTVRAADLEQIRRRIDAATLLFKVRVMSDELRRREQASGSAAPRTSTRKTS